MSHAMVSKGHPCYDGCVGRTDHCQSSSTEDSEPKSSMPAPVLRSVTTSTVPAHDEEQTGSKKHKQRIHKATSAFVRIFSKDKGAVTQQEDARVNRRSVSEPRISALPAGVVRSRKEGPQPQQDQAVQQPQNQAEQHPQNQAEQQPQDQAEQHPQQPQQRLTTRRISFAPLATRENSYRFNATFEPPATNNDSQQANVTFFTRPHQVSGRDLRAAYRAQSSSNPEADLALATVRQRNEQIRQLRNTSKEQQREVDSSRNLVTTYIERNRTVSAESAKWQEQCEEALKSVDQWKLKAEKQSELAKTLQQEVSSVQGHGEELRGQLSDAQERCDQLEEEKATVQYELALSLYQVNIIDRQRSESLNALLASQRDCKTLRDFVEQMPAPVDIQMLQRQRQEALAALQSSQNECEQLKGRNKWLTKSLVSVRKDYELLLDHKVAKFLENPTSEDPMLMRPDEKRDLESALAQSQRNHETERQHHNQAFELAQQYKKETVDLQKENKRLREHAEQLEERSKSEAKQEKHLDAIKDLFMAGKLFADESDLSSQINSLTQQIMEEKVSLESLSKLMHENSNLKESLQKQALLHQGELTALRDEVEKAKEALSGHDLDKLKKALELETARQDMKETLNRVETLKEERDYWRTQCTGSLEEMELALFTTLENRLAFYKNVSLDQQGQIDSLNWDMVMMRDWANEEVSNAGMYLEERDWYKAQLEAYEAQFEELEEFRLQMPWRPEWTTMSDRERSELLAGEERENGADRFVAYRAVRDAYLGAKPSDHEVLAARVAQDAEEVKQREAVKTLRQGFGQGVEQESNTAVTLGPTAPQPLHRRVEDSNEMEGFEQQVDAKVEEHSQTGGPKTGASPVHWAPVVPELPGQHRDGVNTHGTTQDNWETVGAEAVDHAWNDPQVFASLDEDD